MLLRRYRQRGKLQQAEDMFKNTLRILELRLGCESVQFAAVLSDLGRLHEEQGRHEESEQLLKEALRITKKVLGDQCLDVATSLRNLGELCERQGRVNEAQAYFEEVLRIQELKGNVTAAAATRIRLSELLSEPPPLADI